MNSTNKFLEDLQGLLLYCKYKYKTNPSIEDILKKQINEPEAFKLLFEDYLLEHESVLQDFFIQRRMRIKSTYEFSLKDVLIEFETIKKGASDEEFQQALKETSEYELSLIAQLPTKYQELSSYATVSHLLEDTYKAALTIGYEIPIMPIIGTISNDSINAGTFTLENGQPIIIVDEDFLSFIHLFSKIFIQCLPFGNNGEVNSLITNRNDIIKNIKSDPKILFHFKDLIRATLNGSPRKAQQYFLPKDSKYILCTYLMVCAEYFMVGHEIGHSIKHHRNSNVKFWSFNEKCSSSYNENLNHLKEYEADQVGLHLAMQAMAKQGFQADFCYIGVELFFIVNDITLKAKYFSEKGHEDFSAHFIKYPPNKDRREKLREELKKLIPESELLNVLHLPEIIEETMNYLWEESKSDFV